VEYSEYHSFQSFLAGAAAMGLSTALFENLRPFWGQIVADEAIQKLNINPAEQIRSPPEDRAEQRPDDRSIQPEQRLKDDRILNAEQKPKESKATSTPLATRREKYIVEIVNDVVVKILCKSQEAMELYNEEKVKFGTFIYKRLSDASIQMNKPDKSCHQFPTPIYTKTDNFGVDF